MGRLLWVLLHQLLETMIKHTLAMTKINEKEGKYILFVVQSHILPMLGVLSKFLIMRHVPFNFRGLGINQYYHETGSQQLYTLLQYHTETPQTSMLTED